MQYVYWEEAVRFGLAELSRREQLEFWRDAAAHMRGVADNNRGEDGKIGEEGLVALTEIDDMLASWTIRAVEVKNGEDWQSVTGSTAVDIDGLEYAISMPMTRENLIDLPGSVYDALIIQAAVVNEALRQRFLAGTDSPKNTSTTNAG